jgi:hypothetical protein
MPQRGDPELHGEGPAERGTAPAARDCTNPARRAPAAPPAATITTVTTPIQNMIVPVRSVRDSDFVVSTMHRAHQARRTDRSRQRQPDLRPRRHPPAGRWRRRRANPTSVALHQRCQLERVPSRNGPASAVTNRTEVKDSTVAVASGSAGEGEVIHEPGHHGQQAAEQLELRCSVRRCAAGSGRAPALGSVQASCPSERASTIVAIGTPSSAFTSVVSRLKNEARSAMRQQRRLGKAAHPGRRGLFRASIFMPGAPRRWSRPWRRRG